jgi:parallel beta-helix repeat protein
VTQFDYGVVLGPGTLRNTIAGITFAETEWSAIQLNAASGNQLRGNNVSAFSDAGVHVLNGSSSNVLAENKVGLGNGESFVVEGGANQNRLEGNTVSESSDTSVRVLASTGTAIVGNTIAGGSDVAVTAEASQGTIVQGNSIGMAGDASILISQGSRNVVRFNTLGQSADAGVVFSAVGDSLVKGNTMVNAGDAAVALRDGSSNVRVIDNKAQHSSDAGIVVSDGQQNVLRGNVLAANSVGVELSGGGQNVVEFNDITASLGTGIEVGASTSNKVFANLANNNLQGGISVDDASVGNTVEGNEASANGGDGIRVGGGGTVVRNNFAKGNQGWGIFGAPAVMDGGSNGARGNAEAAQCYLIACSDGAGWQRPVRPPEPLDPLEVGLDGVQRPPKVRGLRRKPRRAVVACKRPREGRGARRRSGRRRARVVCTASYRARRNSRRLTGRLVRDDESFARGSRRVKPGRRGRLAMTARRRPRGGNYTLVLSFRDGRGRTSVVRKAVRVR